MRSSIKAMLFQQNQQAIAERQHYYELFQLSPDAYLVTDTNRLIPEANGAIALGNTISCSRK